MLWMTRGGKQTIAIANDGGMDAVRRLHCTAPRDYDIEIEMAHGRKINGARSAMGTGPPA